MFGKFFNFISSMLAVLAGSLLLFVTISISWSIATRALGWHSPLWIVQFNEYALLWITFLGTTWALARGRHVSIDVVTSRLSDGTKSCLSIFQGILGAGLCAALCWYSFWAVLSLYKRGVTDVQAVDVPKYLILSIIPVGFFLLTVQFLRESLMSRGMSEGGGSRLSSTSSSDRSTEVPNER